VKLSDDLDAKLRQEAARRGSTIADVTREAIRGSRRPLPPAGGVRPSLFANADRKQKV
jgi:hypothetical protein